MPLKRVNLLINTNYNFSKAAMQARHSLCSFIIHNLGSQDQSREKSQGPYTSTSNKGRDCFGGAQCGNNLKTGHKMYILKNYIGLNSFRDDYQTLCSFRVWTNNLPYIGKGFFPLSFSLFLIHPLYALCMHTYTQFVCILREK